ncbi:CDP-diacylglycerol--serine O-phosphatidyltransferase [Dongia soli]|uniref:CDP-diacylglycerol--serine O-phosphatidyltransferase n=1 Tax=Dongia soli TaxID=600628 RepID=A0ABU5E9W5_9PROT|nr:CDP-diacylglycerol--serine O-phosphatidyltransferase [Dongia soli]MDY0882697.1 CDP-diacylglycerol--serine O-phosphatidyltransferase [Dongia soli]
MRRTRLRDHSINRLIPNMLTLMALCAGLTSIRFALVAKWELAVVAILVAAIFDALDGRIARLLDSTSKFGAELDSLSDFISFGVAPAMILYLWALDQSGRIGWGLVLVFSACTALRLARFNTKLDNTDLPAWTSRFFTGVPAPAGAALALMPLVGYLEYGPGFFNHPFIVGVTMVGVAGLMVSRLPTFSFKRLKVTQAWVLPAMLSVTIFIALLASETWKTLLFSGLAYLASIPFSYRQYQRLQRQRPLATPPVLDTEDIDHL